MCQIDLSQLVGGESLTIPYTISKNGLGIKIRTLIDTGANGYIFINSELAQKASRFLGVPIQRLKVPYRVKGFDGQPSNPIEYYLEINL
jgi:predicted aspartyl protease